jgi:hypothetical protein
VVRARQPLPHNLIGLVDLKARSLQVLHNPLGSARLPSQTRGEVTVVYARLRGAAGE